MVGVNHCRPVWAEHCYIYYILDRRKVLAIESRQELRIIQYHYYYIIISSMIVSKEYILKLFATLALLVYYNHYY